MKRLSLCVVLALTLALLLTACGDKPQNETTLPTQPTQQTTPGTASAPQVTEPSETTPSDHEHILSNVEYGAEQHRYVCDCGMAMAEPHSLDENGRCSVCGVTVEPYYDGQYFILTHDEQGNLLSRTLYDAQGAMVRWETREHKFYSDGNLMFLQAKYGRAGSEEITTSETYYIHKESGEGVRVDYAVNYDADGSYMIMYYDQRENMIRQETYNEQGQLTETDRHDYVYDPDGVHVYLTRYINDVLDETRDYVITENGELRQISQTWYIDGKKDFRQDYVYNESGELVEILNFVFDENGNPVAEA